MAMRMLIVDDEAAILFAYKHLFQSEQLVVDTVSVISDAIGCLMQNKYDIILTDLRLDIEDTLSGFQVISAARQRDQAVKIILATAYGSPEVERLARELGADYYLEKPIPMTELRQLIDEIIRHRL